MNMKNIEQKLRHADYKQAKLYFFCNFIALMIITAYALLMKSPTILTILPEGYAIIHGDEFSCLE